MFDFWRKRQGQPDFVIIGHDAHNHHSHWAGPFNKAAGSLTFMTIMTLKDLEKIE